MAKAKDNILFEDMCLVDDMNPEGKSNKAFKNIGRVVARSLTYDVSILVDINIELFKVKMKDRLSIALTKSLALESSTESKTREGVYDQSGKPSLLDKYDYGMYGKVFKCDVLDDHKMAIYISYGGLLMKMVGEQAQLAHIDLDSNIYCLIKLVER